MCVCEFSLYSGLHWTHWNFSTFLCCKAAASSAAIYFCLPNIFSVHCLKILTMQLAVLCTFRGEK